MQARARSDWFERHGGPLLCAVGGSTRPNYNQKATFTCKKNDVLARGNGHTHGSLPKLKLAPVQLCTFGCSGSCVLGFFIIQLCISNNMHFDFAWVLCNAILQNEVHALLLILFLNK